MVDLNFSENCIGDLDISFVCNIMMVQKDSLEKIHLNENKISEKGARSLSEALMHMKTLKVLRLNSNPLGTRGVELILQVSHASLIYPQQPPCHCFHILLPAGTVLLLL